MSFTSISQRELGLYLLRFGLVAVYLYFGFSQLVNPQSWSGLVPDWVTLFSTFEAVTIIYVNAIFEIVFAGFLIFGIWTRWVSFILGAHLAVITIILGFSPAGVRDFGLMLATFAHGLFEED